MYSSINPFTQNKVCSVYFFLRTDTSGQKIADQRRDLSNHFLLLFLMALALPRGSAR